MTEQTPMQTSAATEQLATIEPPNPVQTYASLSIVEINGFHRRATTSAAAARAKAEEATHYALLAGTRLEQLRDSTPHGEWGHYFTDRKNLGLTPNSAHIGQCAEFEFSQDTATRYIETAKRLRMEQAMSGKAQKRLITIADAPELDDESREWLNKLTEGRSLRQLYLDLEIISAPAPKESPAKPALPSGPNKSVKQDRLEDARESFHTWRAVFDKLVKIGSLDDLDPDGLLALKDFLAGARDRVNARLK